MEGFKFRDLLVYQKGRQFIDSIYRITKSFPRDETFGLTSQLRRAAVSINLNIAEGNGRTTRNEQRRFYYIAHGSLFECVSIFDLCLDRGYIVRDVFIELESAAREILALLNGLIRYVR